MRIRLLLVATMFASVSMGAQTAPAITDSVSVRFVDVDLRTVVQGLGQYLDHPMVIGSLSGNRVTLETPHPVPRASIPALLRGLLESQQFELRIDTVAGLYRITSRMVVQPQSNAGPTTPQAGPASTALVLFTLRLKHARAADVAGTVNALYGRAGALGELGGPASQTLSAALRDSRLPTGSQPAPVAPQAVASAAGINAALAGEVTIVPDPATNSLLIRATQRDFELIQAAVQELDVRPLQVMIEVLIAEVRKDRGFSFGVAAQLPATAIPGAGDATVSGSTTGIGLGDFAVSVMNVGGVDLNATLRAAAARGDVTIASRPIVLAANNEQAEILVGSQRPFVQVSRSLPTDAPQRDQVVQYKDVGTRLSVRPTISADGYVMLEVLQEVNAVTTETAFDAPVISTRSVQTRLLVRNGQTAVLGGLSDRQRDSNQSGVPILSSIPFLGGLFGRASRRATETELFLFLTPTVLSTDADVDSATTPLRNRVPERAP
jgi:general secretion pathway protein D